MKVTVFTPTYNRGYIIEKLYNSLATQTIFDFEWLVIDDGSTDGTDKVFEQFLSNKNKFPIRYHKVENGGKHRAINRGVQLAQGELFFIVDSDDFLTNDSLEKVIKWEQQLPKDQKWAGVSGLRGYTKDKIIGKTFLGKYVDATSIERDKFNIKGDKSEVFYTDVLKQFPFKEFEGENFITEDSVWLLIAEAGYKIRWNNEINYLCEYLDDGLTRNYIATRIKNPEGVFYSSSVYIKVYKGNAKRKYSAIYTSYIVGSKNGLSKKQISQKLNVGKWQINLSICLSSINTLLSKLRGRK